MIKDTMARVNQLRQQAMKDPVFLDTARKHAKAIKQTSAVTLRRKKKRKTPVKTLATIYQPYFDEARH
jgi:hypothetical protein